MTWLVSKFKPWKHSTDRPKSPSLSDIGALVPNLPNPTPEQLGSEAMKQLMTWGTLNATPRISAGGYRCSRTQDAISYT